MIPISANVAPIQATRVSLLLLVSVCAVIFFLRGGRINVMEKSYTCELFDIERYWLLMTKCAIHNLKNTNVMKGFIQKEWTRAKALSAPSTFNLSIHRNINALRRRLFTD